MSVKVGDRLPDFTFQSVKQEKPGVCSAPFSVNSRDLFKGRKAVLVGLPGAFTPVCSSQHVPGFVAKAEELKKKGIDIVAVTSTNDAFVLGAWNNSVSGWGRVEMLADGNGDFAKAIGMAQDLGPKGMGTRTKRFAMLLDDMTVKYIGVDETGLDKASAEAILKAAS